ncbi:MAG: acetylornithine carbamoyltransferase, partial [Marinicaulis sp.]|nr:acetylornithine carbamoyltransferase [Marinicaulis sp.]
EDYILDERYIEQASKDAGAHGEALTISHDIDEAYDGAEVVYAKSWGALPFFGNWEPEKGIRDRFKHFIVDEEKMAKTNSALVSHCLPMRRNVKMTDAVFESANCIAYEEAENRLHVQKAIMKALAG